MIDIKYLFILNIIITSIMRYYYVKYNKKVKGNAYFILFIYIFVITFYLTKKINLSLFTSFVVLLGRTMYRYSKDKPVHKLNKENSLLFCLGVSIPFLVNYYKDTIDDNYINYFNFLVIIYIVISLQEYILHKYVMHCDRDSQLVKNIRNIPILGSEFWKTCDHHVKHHLDVNPDMSIDNPSTEVGLYMGWKVFLYFFPLTVLNMYFSRYITNCNISDQNIIIFSIILCFVWQYVWNKVHVDMHNLENKYSIMKGPYDEGLFNLNPLTKLLFRNHQYHHLQKGEKKGNYNIIAIGVDEWLNSNNKIIDNRDYCKKNNDDIICQA